MLDQSLRIAANRMQHVAGVYAEAQKQVLQSIDLLFAQIQERGADSLSRTQLYQYARYRIVLKDVRGGAQTIMTAQQTAVDAAVREAFVKTLGTTMDALAGAGRWTLVPDKLLDSYMSTPWSGKNFSKRIWTNTNKLARDLENHMRDMIVNGKSSATVKQQLAKDFGVNYEVADTLIRTEISAVTNAANLAGFAANGNTRVRYVVDDNPCGVCLAYAMTDGGEYAIGEEPILPAHPRCRCRYAPVNAYTAFLASQRQATGGAAT